jgi:hypothetical protein
MTVACALKGYFSFLIMISLFTKRLPAQSDHHSEVIDSVQFEVQDGRVTLRWYSSAMLGDCYFTLERLKGKQDYRLIHVCPGMIDATPSQHYQYTDSIKATSDLQYRILVVCPQGWDQTRVIRYRITRRKKWELIRKE